MSEASRRALGIDFGTKRIGLAVCDDVGWTARPLEVYRRKGTDEDFQYIAQVVKRESAMRIVVGIPNRLSGEPGPESERALEFVLQIKEVLPGFEISTVDEALTTYEANQLMDQKGIRDRKKRKELRDAYAAAVILQEDLDLRSSKEQNVGEEPGFER